MLPDYCILTVLWPLPSPPFLPSPLPSTYVCVLGEVCAGVESRPHMLDKTFITEPPPDHCSVNTQCESALLDATVPWLHILQGALRHGTS